MSLKEGTPMTSTRILEISISWVVLSAAPLICAPDVKPSEATLILEPRPGIQKFELQPRRFPGCSLRAVPRSPPLIDVRDLSRYQQFKFVMSLLSVSIQEDMQSSQ